MATSPYPMPNSMTTRFAPGPFGETPNTPMVPTAPAEGPAQPMPAMNAAPPAQPQPQVIPGPFGQRPQGTPDQASWDRRLQMMVPAIVAAFGPRFGAGATVAMLGGFLRGQEKKRAATERAEQTAARRAMDAARFRMDALEQVASLPPEQQAVYLDSLADVGMQLYGVDLRGELGRMQGASAATTARVATEQATAKQKADAASVVKANDQTNPGNWSAPDETGETRPREWWVARAGTPGLLPGQKPKETPKTREIRTRNADGSEKIQIVEDAPGFEATSAAEPEQAPANLDAAILAAHTAGDTAEVNRLLTLKQRTASAGRAPERGGDGAVDKGTRALAEMAATNPAVLQGLTPTESGNIRKAIAADPQLRQQFEATRMEPIRAPARDVLSALKRLIEPDEQGGFRLTAGARSIYGVGPGRAMRFVPGSDAANAKAALDQVTGRLTLDVIGQMKAQSTTGATGFGAMNAQELGVIESAATTLKGEISEQMALGELLKMHERFSQVLEEAPADRGGAGAPKVGDTKTFPNGNKASWDGQGWAQVP